MIIYFLKKYSFLKLLVIMGSFIMVTPIKIQAQTMQKVSHLSGSKEINEITVSVTSKGQTAILGDKNLCNGETGPYYIGYNTNNYNCRNGSYSFTFTPPVTEIKLNFTGLSKSNDYDEEMVVFINGKHYQIKTAGLLNSCEKMAVLSPEGNIKGCNDCSTSGWNDTYIEGPIYSLTILDSVIKGEPAGALFALYMGNVSLDEQIVDLEGNISDFGGLIKIYKRESAAGADIIIESDTLDIKLISILDHKGEKQDYHLYSHAPYIHIDVSNFIKETEYTLELSIDRKHVLKKFILW